MDVYFYMAITGYSAQDAEDVIRGERESYEML